ncbi:MAG TPA: sulfurtransferase [Desulfobacteraceae bacterium]|nr:sulfurtransferase [Desulfobacteraceae bacterium]
MKQNRAKRHFIIMLALALGFIWSLGSAGQTESSYPNARFAASPQWLHDHLGQNGIIVADVRTDDYFDGAMIPGAVRLPWSEFRTSDPGQDLASVFVGVNKAQQILGRRGISRNDTVVLYDSTARDGGATASYVFWVLDLLGHENKKILERGIDGWKAAGFDLATTEAPPEPILYQAPADEIRTEKLIHGDFVYKRLGDRFYQIVDVRSKAEYTGEKGTKGLRGNPLKRGHIPTAVNINYTGAWSDTDTKGFKSYPELQSLYRGLDPEKGVIVYCNSGRRSSFSYYILRLMGFEHVHTYEASWKEWGHPDKFYPVETREHRLTGSKLPGTSSRSASSGNAPVKKALRTSGTNNGNDSGYISCGG